MPHGAELCLSWQHSILFLRNFRPRAHCQSKGILLAEIFIQRIPSTSSEVVIFQPPFRRARQLVPTFALTIHHPGHHVLEDSPFTNGEDKMRRKDVVILAPMKVASNPSRKGMAFNFAAFAVVGYDVMAPSRSPLAKGDSDKGPAKVAMHACTFCGKVFIDIHWVSFFITFFIFLPNDLRERIIWI